MESNYSKRTFNLRNSYRQQSSHHTEAEAEREIPKIEKSIVYDKNESGLGSFLVRLILAVTVFSAIMLMKNSSDKTVGLIYDAVEAWSVSNYTVPEEYSVEKFVDAVKSGNILSVFDNAYSFSCIAPCDAEIAVRYGEKDVNGIKCLGTILSAESVKEILSVSDGMVSDVSESASFGTCITVTDANGVSVKYGWCGNASVSVGDAVQAGTVIAETDLGNDGRYYVYIEISANGKLLDPEKCFESKK